MRSRNTLLPAEKVRPMLTRRLCPTCNAESIHDRVGRCVTCGLIAAPTKRTRRLVPVGDVLIQAAFSK